MTRKPTPATILDDVLAGDANRPVTIRNDAIKIDGGTQMRAQLDAATVTEYADAMTESGWGKFPPIIAYYDGSDYWLADGFHRLAAWRSIADFSDALIPADVRSGTRRDAILHAAGANASHGLRRTNADKRRAVETLLRDDDWRHWSNREIGRRCNVSESFVREVKKDLGIDTAHETQYIHPKTGEPTKMHTANIGAKPVETEEQLRQRIRENDRRMKDEINSRFAAVADAAQRMVAERGATPTEPEASAPAPEDKWVAAWEHRLPEAFENRVRRLAAEILPWTQAWTDDKKRTWRDVADRNPQHANSPFRQALDGECRRRGLVMAGGSLAAVIEEVFSNLAAGDNRLLSDGGEDASTADDADDAEKEALTAADMQVMQAPDDRIPRCRRLIGIYNQAISVEDEYGALTGCYSETTAPKRELQRLIERLQHTVDLLEGKTTAAAEEYERD